jgi:hypothetical protein
MAPMSLKTLFRNFNEIEFDNWHLFGLGAIYIVHLPAIISTAIIQKTKIGIECNPLPAFLFNQIGIVSALTYTTAFVYLILFTYAVSKEPHKAGKISSVVYPTVFIMMGIDSLNDILMIFNHPFAPVLFNAIMYFPSLLHIIC